MAGCDSRQHQRRPTRSRTRRTHLGNPATPPNCDVSRERDAAPHRIPSKALGKPAHLDQPSTTPRARGRVPTQLVPAAGYDSGPARRTDCSRCNPSVHHPPFATGVGWMDRAGFIGLDRLTAVLTDHPVDRVLCGHFHRPINSTIAGIPAQVCISTVQHIDLDLAPEAGPSLIIDPVGYRSTALPAPAS